MKIFLDVGKDIPTSIPNWKKKKDLRDNYVFLIKIARYTYGQKKQKEKELCQLLHAELWSMCFKMKDDKGEAVPEPGPGELHTSLYVTGVHWGPVAHISSSCAFVAKRTTLFL